MIKKVPAQSKFGHHKKTPSVILTFAINRPGFRSLTDLQLQTRRTDIFFPDWCAYFLFFFYLNTSGIRKKVPALLLTQAWSRTQSHWGWLPAINQPSSHQAWVDSAGPLPGLSQWHVFIPVKYGESCRHRPICCCCCCWCCSWRSVVTLSTKSGTGRPERIMTDLFQIMKVGTTGRRKEISNVWMCCEFMASWKDSELLS